MAQLIPDDFDFAAYARETNPKAKVRPASLFAGDVAARFAPRDPSKAKPEMFSTKLRGKIEFRPSEVTVWTGYNGHRKSMFMGQVALDMMVQRQRVLMASFEMDPADTLARMCRQATATDKPSKLAQANFSKWTDDKLWIFDHMGRISPAEVMAVVRYFAEELKGTHVFIDSMMMVCKSEEHLDEQKQFATDMVRAAQEYGIHLHLVAHCRKPQAGEDKPPTKYDLRGSAAISDQAHNIITVWANKAKKAEADQNWKSSQLASDPDARVCIEKQRNGAWEGAVQLWFDNASLKFRDNLENVCEPYRME